MECKTYWLSGCVQKEAYISLYEKATNVLELSKKFPFKSNPSILIWIQKLQLQLIQKNMFYHFTKNTASLVSGHGERRTEENHEGNAD